MVYICFDKKTSVGAVKNENISNQELAEQLHKPIIRKFEKQKVYSPFMENIWGTDIFSKYAWVIPLKDKKLLQLLMLFHKILDESN